MKNIVVFCLACSTWLTTAPLPAAAQNEPAPTKVAKAEQPGTTRHSKPAAKGAPRKAHPPAPGLSKQLSEIRALQEKILLSQERGQAQLHDKAPPPAPPKPAAPDTSSQYSYP